MKELHEMTFDEVVDDATGVVLKELIRGELRSGVYEAARRSVLWRRAMDAKEGRPAAPALDGERLRMIESMCLTMRHDFGLDKSADFGFSSGMTDGERQQLRGQMGKLYDHHFAPVLAAVTAERDQLRAALKQQSESEDAV